MARRLYFGDTSKIKSMSVDNNILAELQIGLLTCYPPIGNQLWICLLNHTDFTVYPKKYAHAFVVLCFVEVMQSFIMTSHEVFIHIHQGCFAGTGAIVRLPQCQWSKPDGYGKISQCITTTKHSKAKTVCIYWYWSFPQICLECPTAVLSCWPSALRQSLITMWVLSQYKDCLSQVWGFPC